MYIFSRVTRILLILHMIVVHDQNEHKDFHLKVSNVKVTHSLKQFLGHYFLPVVNVNIDTLL